MTVRDVFTFAWLLDEAGAGPLARGVAYSVEGRVDVFRDEPDRVDAIVRGTEPYAVELLLEAGHPVWFCSCPAAAEGALCKHAVATALALTGTPPEPAGTPTSAAAASTPGRKAAAAPDVRAWRKRVTSTFAAGGRFVEYRDAPEWAAGVHELLDDIEELLAAGHADAVATLAEDAHRRAETALNRIDEPGGWLTDISHRVAGLHRSAVAQARPDPRTLAERLFTLEVDSHTLATFHRAAATYADALGAEGIARYRELAEAAWAVTGLVVATRACWPTVSNLDAVPTRVAAVTPAIGAVSGRTGAAPTERTMVIGWPGWNRESPTRGVQLPAGVRARWRSGTLCGWCCSCVPLPRRGWCSRALQPEALG